MKTLSVLIRYTQILLIIIIIVSVLPNARAQLARAAGDLALPTAQLPSMSNHSDIMIWGENFSRIHAVPWRAIRDITQVSVNQHHVLALNTNGRVIGWGRNYKGELTIPRAARSDVVQIATGIYHSVALKSNGQTVVWGNKSAREGGATPTDVVRIAAGDSHTVFLHTDGSISVRGPEAQRAIPPALDAAGIVDIAASNTDSLALLSTGEVVQWGSDIIPPQETQFNTVAVYASGTAYAALQQSGNLIIWGSIVNNVPILPENAVLEDGDVCACVYIRFAGQAAMQSFETSMAGIGIVRRTGFVTWIPTAGQSPIPFPDPTVRVKFLGINDAHNAGVALKMPLTQGVAATPTPDIRIDARRNEKFTGTGSIVGWGDNTALTTIPDAVGQDVVQVVAGRSHAVALRNDGVIVTWGNNSYGQLNMPTEFSTPRPETDPLRVVQIAAGAYHTVALRMNGQVVAWGNNTTGQATVPEKLADVVQVTAGARHSLALLASGEVVGWGDNMYGQSTTPEFTQIQKIVSGANHNLAILASGQAYAWGRNQALQLNIDTTSSDIVDIAANENTSMVLNAQGVVTVFGDNAYQQTQVPDAIIQSLGSGSFHVFAIGIDGQPYAWGLNSSNQTAIPADTTRVSMLTGGANFSLALIPVDDVGFTSQIPTAQPLPDADQLLFTAIDAGPNMNIGYRHQQIIVWGDTYVPRSVLDSLKKATFVYLPDNITDTLIGITKDGRIIEWNAQQQAHIPIPADLQAPHAYDDPMRPVDIACGYFFCVALTQDGHVRLFGDTTFIYNACLNTFPDNIGNIAQISVSGRVTLLDKNNMLTMYGCPDLNYPAEWDSATDIHENVFYSAIVKPDNSVHVFAKDDSEYITFDTKIDVPISDIQLLEWGRILFVLYADQTVERFTVEGNGTINKKTYPYTDIIAISTGDDHYIMLHDNGEITSLRPCGSFDDCPHYDTSDRPIVDTVLPPAQITTQVGRLDITSCNTTHTDCITHTPTDTVRADISSTFINDYAVAVGLNDRGEPESFNYELTEYTRPINYTTYQKVIVGAKDDFDQINLQAFLTTSHEFFVNNRNTMWLRHFDEEAPDYFKQNVADFAVNNTHIAIQNIAGGVWSNRFGELNTPLPVKHIAAGPDFVVVLYVDGTIGVWSESDANGITVIPASATDIIEIDAGDAHAMALRADGRIISWGAEADDFGQADVPFVAQRGMRAIAAGNTFSVGLSDTGQIILWGKYPATFNSINTDMTASGRVITSIFAGAASLGTISQESGSMPTPIPTNTPMQLPTATTRSLTGDITLNQAFFDFDTMQVPDSYTGIGNPFTCININCPTLSMNSPDGYAMEFTRTYGTELQSTVPVDLINTSFTVSAWFKRKQLHINNPFLSFGTINRPNEFFSMGINSNNRLYCSFYGNDLISNHIYVDTDWHQYACTFNVSTMMRRIYRDGVVIAQDRITTPLTIRKGQISLGRDATAGDSADGWLDNVALYTSDLSSELTTYADFPGTSPVIEQSFNQLTFQSTPLNTAILTCSGGSCPTWQYATHQRSALFFDTDQAMEFTPLINTKAGISMLYWAKAKDARDSVVVAQDNGLQMGFTAENMPFCTIGTTTLIDTSFTDSTAWHQYGCAYNPRSKTMMLIVDGNITRQQNNVAYNSKNAFMLGANADLNNGFHGLVDDVTYYTRPLNAAEFKILYESTNPNALEITPTPPAVSYTPSKTYTTTKSPTRTNVYYNTKTRRPATATAKAARYRSPTPTRSNTPTASSTRTARPSSTRPPTRTLRVPTATPTQATPTASLTRTPMFITRTIMALRTATYAATYVAQTKTATVEFVTQTAAAQQTQQAGTIQTLTAYPVPATQTSTATAYPIP